MGSQHGQDHLPARIRRGHRHDCPECGYTGKNLIDHLEKRHTDLHEKYEMSRRGLWVLDDSGEKVGSEDDGNEEESSVEEVRDELRRKERRIVELEARLEEKNRQIEELRKTRERLVEISEKALERVPEIVNDGLESAAIQFEGSEEGGKIETVAGERPVEQVKGRLTEEFERSNEVEGRRS